MRGADAPTRRALVLYGRVGTYESRTASLKPGVPADPTLWQTCAHTIHKHVVLPWKASGRLDVFVQTWNPELARAMQRFWSPAALDVAPQNSSLRCPFPLNLCVRTMWALLGMKRGLALRTQWARAHGHQHATVLAMRHDVYWFSSLPPLLTSPAVRLWLPLDCELSVCTPGGGACERVASSQAALSVRSRRRAAPKTPTETATATVSFRRELLGRDCSNDKWLAFCATNHSNGGRTGAKGR